LNGGGRRSAVRTVACTVVVLAGIATPAARGDGLTSIQQCGGLDGLFANCPPPPPPPAPQSKPPAPPPSSPQRRRVDDGGCAGGAANPARTPARKLDRAVLCLINRERAQHTLGALRPNSRLDLASSRYARLLIRSHVFSHFARRLDPIERVAATGYLRGASTWVVGETLAWGEGKTATPVRIVRAWLRSAPHRHDLLYPNFRDVGIAVLRGAPVRHARRPATYVVDFAAKA
jgi:uncharacterized protein YkwD